VLFNVGLHENDTVFHHVQFEFNQPIFPKITPVQTGFPRISPKQSLLGLLYRPDTHPVVQQAVSKQRSDAVFDWQISELPDKLLVANGIQ